MTTKTFYHPMEQTACVQDLIGGIPVGTITGLLGPPGAGKSTLGMQALAEIVAVQKGNLLIFDTENKFHVFLHLCEGLSERFGLNLNLVRVKGRIKKSGGKDPTYSVDWEMEDDVDPKATNVFVIHCPNVTPISIMLGAGFELKTYESGKFKVISLAGAAAGSVDITEAPIAKFMQKHKCSAMLFDSITNPFDIIPAVGENFPARADAEQIIMLQLHSLAAEYDLPILMTVHESKNDTNPFSKQLKMEGGKSIGYNLAYVLYLMEKNEIGLLPKGAVKPKSSMPRDQRAVFVSRAPSRPPWANVRYFTITEKGLVDGDGEGSDQDADDPTET
jgi:energy-coupling factor transporter ATP-binding protein EcfA2